MKSNVDAALDSMSDADAKQAFSRLSDRFAGSDAATKDFEVHFLDSDGYCVQKNTMGHATRTSDEILADLSRSAVAKGQTVVVPDANHVCGVRPPTREQLAVQAKIDRIAVLRAIGWERRSDLENAELDGLSRDLGI